MVDFPPMFGPSSRIALCKGLSSDPRTMSFGTKWLEKLPAMDEDAQGWPRPVALRNGEGADDLSTSSGEQTSEPRLREAIARLRWRQRGEGDTGRERIGIVKKKEL